MKPLMTRSWRTWPLLLASLLGCSPAYREFNNPLRDVDEMLEKRPLTQAAPEASFPARIAVARVATRSCAPSRHDRREAGQYLLEPSRTPAAEKAAKKLASLPSVAGVASINAILQPDCFPSDFNLRVAASRLKADVLLVYTICTSVEHDGVPLGPVTVATFGMIPTRSVTATVSATCALVDVRTGYILCRARATHSDTELATHWHKPDAASAAIDQAEDEAVAKLMEQFDPAWREVVKLHAK